MKTSMMIICASFIALALGLYISGRYIGQGEVIATLCVMGEVAVKEGFLDEQEYLSLSESAGRKIKADYPVLVDGFALSDEAIKRASPGSNCSQILVALTKGME